jgi:hypothetical protein
MEANLKTEKITHQLHTIQFTDKAIENLRWNKGTEKRQRIKVKFFRVIKNHSKKNLQKIFRPSI